MWKDDTGIRVLLVLPKGAGLIARAWVHNDLCLSWSATVADLEVACMRHIHGWPVENGCEIIDASALDGDVVEKYSQITPDVDKRGTGLHDWIYGTWIPTVSGGRRMLAPLMSVIDYVALWQRAGARVGYWDAAIKRFQWEEAATANQVR